MKKLLSVTVILAMIMCSFASCGAKEENTDNSGKLSIVTTIFPEYDWTMEILGEQAENADVTMLLDSGVDLHSYQPSADDIIKISECDVFIYVGGNSDSWVDDALKEKTNDDMVIVNLMDVLGDRAKEEEVVEGMQAEEEEEEEEGPEYDEHVWLSLKNAVILTKAIEEAIAQADPGNADVYAANLAAYTDELNALDAQYEEAVANASKDTLLFADRFPFRYMADDYGLKYYAAFVGCSAESEASFETIAFLADKVNELKLNKVMTLEGSDHKIAETVISTSKKSDVEIESMDSMQSITSEDVEHAVRYLTIMEENLEALKAALK